MKIEIVPQQTLIIEYEKYAAWPSFKAIGSQRLGGLWRAHFLRHALTAEDLSCAAWRAPIPYEILKLLQGFVDCHAELIEMAQTAPDIFTRWAHSNPALTLIAATYWRYRPSKEVPEIQARKDLWYNLEPRDILQYARCDSSRSFLKTLGKIPPEQCYEFVITRVRDQWQVPEKRRLLQHLRKITVETTWLLGCFPPILDPGIHRLASDAPYFDEFHIGHIISDLTNRREMRCLEVWPYRNQIHSWEQLLNAYDRFLRKVNHVPERFGSPPVLGLQTETLHIEPITRRTGLEGEAAEMQNCVSTYLVQVHHGECYAYRLFRPERATVLIDRRTGRWSVAEAMLAANERQVESSTWNLLIDWVMTAGN